jgi:AcrR family transcriptional regulator
MSGDAKADRARAPIRRRQTPRAYLRADERRAQILDAAKSIFARRGYHGVNVEDICNEARIARGTLYQHFDNKHDVMLALMEELAARVANVLETRPQLLPPPREHAQLPLAIIVAFCKGRLRQLLDAVFVDEPTLRLLLREARGLEGSVDRVMATIDRLILRALEADLKAAQEAGFLRAGSSKLIARYLLGGVEKMVLMAIEADEEVELGAIVDLAVEMELFGILNEEVRRHEK